MNSVANEPKRFLYDQFKTDERLVIIKGQRGTGKTTLLLQLIKSEHYKIEETLYISLDDIWFSANTLSDLVEEFVTDGGRYLFIDEVHRYKNWSRELKNIYDFYPDLKMIVTGSSALSFYINSADLGRRASVYSLPEMSFREFLNFTKQTNFKTYSLTKILKHHEKIAFEINSTIKSLKFFKEYLQTGAYPFILDGASSYFAKLESTINTVIDSDIPSIENINFDSRLKLKKLLLMMASSTPFKINISELSRKLETTRDMLPKYLTLLHKAGLINFLTVEGIGHTILRKPDKIYFSNTNLMYAIHNNIDIGTIRETFFLSQLSYKHLVTYPKSGDFIIDNRLTFEIGGKNKGYSQIKHLKNSFLAIDDIAYGDKKRIPLWLFGFLY